jgi:hypothetical protein
MFFSNSFCYFVIFVDVYTNHIWYYPLVMKSDVFSTFHRFQVFVEHKFSQKKINLFKLIGVVNIVI